ncbi:alpha/beta fold hydrolase [Paenibacillus polymyxa]|uniref:alpha/beta fold hydrolase n=1 Tax=Paenibacillus polymyxa TaxID=1406 RepID=UPI0025B66DCB|nr:alpha/beta fold hydrolase [Paenibacillus polymyxa]MDN4089454.1 alpha/beta hydrolase [Paenibacillus polymyxa]
MKFKKITKRVIFTTVAILIILLVAFIENNRLSAVKALVSKNSLNDGKWGFFALSYSKVPGVIGSGYEKRITGDNDNKKVVPTLFIHGLNGSGDTFNGVFNGHWTPGEDFNKDIEFTDIITVGSVQENDDLIRLRLWSSFEESQITERTSENPIIQIIFPQKQHTFNKQVKWLKEAIEKLQTEYNFDTINIVGHSMGGVIAAKYIEDTYESDFPRVDKLITLDSPIDGAVLAKRFKFIFSANKDLAIGSKAIKQLSDNKGFFDPRTKVVSYAATKDDKWYFLNIGDVVSTKSAFKLKDIAQGPVTRIEVPYSHGGETGIINPDIMKDVANYLWGDSEITDQRISFHK